MLIISQQVDSFYRQPLEVEYSYLWIDVFYEKLRDNGQVISIALMIAYGIHREGKRDILAIEHMYEETDET